MISNTPPLNFEITKTVSTTQYNRLHYNIDRGNPYTSKNKGLSCKSKFFGLSSILSANTDCHFIKIEESTFSKFNPYKYRRVPLNEYSVSTIGSAADDANIYNTYDLKLAYTSSVDTTKVNYNIFQEAMLLGVTNINGKIQIIGSNFAYFIL